MLSALSSIAFGCPVPIATGLVNTRLFFTVLIAFIFRQEKTSFKKLLVTFTGVFGAFITSGINLQHIPFLNVNFGVYLSRVMMLEPCDIIATGTPSGVGFAIKPEPKFLKHGDVVRMEIEGIGVLENTVVEEKLPFH